MRDLTNLIFEPASFFQLLKKKPTWFAPFLIVSVAGMLIALVVQPVQTQLAIVTLGEILSPDEIQQALHRARLFNFISASLVPLFTLIRWSIVSGLILVLSGLFTGNLKFKQSLSIIGYASLILALGSAVNAAVVRIRGLDAITSQYDLWLIGLNFWSVESLGLPLYLLLGEITVFSIWYLVLVAVGLTVVAGLSRLQAASVAGFVWLLGVAFKIGITLMGSQFSPAS